MLYLLGQSEQTTVTKYYAYTCAAGLPWKKRRKLPYKCRTPPLPRDSNTKLHELKVNSDCSSQP